MPASSTRASAQFNRTLKLIPDFELAHLWRGQALEQLGQLDSAQSEIDQAVRLSRGTPLTRWRWPYVLGTAGQRDSARAMVTRLAEPGEHYVPSYEIAKAYLAVGDRRTAMGLAGPGVRRARALDGVSVRRSPARPAAGGTAVRVPATEGGTIARKAASPLAPDLPLRPPYPAAFIVPRDPRPGTDARPAGFGRNRSGAALMGGSYKQCEECGKRALSIAAQVSRLRPGVPAPRRAGGHSGCRPASFRVAQPARGAWRDRHRSRRHRPLPGRPGHRPAPHPGRGGFRRRVLRGGLRRHRRGPPGVGLRSPVSAARRLSGRAHLDPRPGQEPQQGRPRSKPCSPPATPSMRTPSSAAGTESHSREK